MGIVPCGKNLIAHCCNRPGIISSFDFKRIHSVSLVDPSNLYNSTKNI